MKLSARISAIVCGLLLGAGLWAAIAAPVAGVPAPPPLKNWCEGGQDSPTCKSCEFHDCKVDDARGVKATGVVTLDMRRMLVTVTGAPSKLRLNMIGELDMKRYFITYEALPLTANDPATVCEVDLHQLNRDLPPPMAREMLEEQVADAQKDAQVLGEQAGSFQGYDVRIWGLYDAKRKRYMLDMMLVFHDVWIEQTCRYKTQPAGTSEPHWAALSFTFAAAKRN